MDKKKDGKYTVFPENENEAGSSLRQFTGMFEQLSDSKDFKRKKKKKSKKKKDKKGKKSKREKLNRFLDQLYKSDTKGKKAKGKKGKSKKHKGAKQAKRELIYHLIKETHGTSLDTASYCVKRYADHKLPVK